MTPDYLANLHFHPRDARIKFYEGPHIYTVDEGTGQGMDGVKFTSVTTWNHHHFEEFDANKIIDNMMSSKNWPNNKYYGKTKDEIMELWDANRDAAASAGTKMHYNIECFYNNALDAAALENPDIEFQYFLRFHEDWTAPGRLLRPYRTEWTVFHEEARLTGSIDMVFENLDPATGEPDGTLSIYDWKRCKEIVKSNAFGKFATTPEITHLPDTNYWHYCLQLNTYKAILEAKYDKTVTDLYLVCLHPENKNGSYIRIRVVDLQEEVGAMLASRALSFQEQEQNQEPES